MNPTEPGPMLLAGGVTLPEHRGRGAYRALVRARWDAAQRAGAPALVTQAQAASRPILERLGFRATGVIKVLVDGLSGGVSSLIRPGLAHSDENDKARGRGHGSDHADREGHPRSVG
jgi:hypothetical protein